LDFPYGSEDSIRTDTFFRDDADDPAAIYDVKTGRATLRPGRVAKLREKVGAGPKIPVIEMHVLRGVSLKGQANQQTYVWIIVARVWHPSLPDIGNLVASGDAA
jgi:hypothetical protein